MTERDVTYASVVFAVMSHSPRLVKWLENEGVSTDTLCRADAVLFIHPETKGLAILKLPADLITKLCTVQEDIARTSGYIWEITSVMAEKTIEPYAICLTVHANRLRAELALKNGGDELAYVQIPDLGKALLAFIELDKMNDDENAVIPLLVDDTLLTGSFYEDPDDLSKCWPGASVMQFIPFAKEKA